MVIQRNSYSVNQLPEDVMTHLRPLTLVVALAGLALATGIASRHAFSQGDTTELIILSTSSQNGELAPCG